MAELGEHDNPIPTRARQRLDTRNRILDVARAEIAEVGLAKVRIEHIARKAGVSRPTIYSHFPAKEDFLRAIEVESQQATLAALETSLEEEGSGDLLHRTLDAVFDLLDAAEPRVRREVFAWIVRDPKQADWLGSPLFGFLTRRLALAGPLRAGSTDLAPEALTRIVMTALFGFLAIESEASTARRRAAHHMLDLLLEPSD